MCNYSDTVAEKKETNTSVIGDLEAKEEGSRNRAV